MAAVTIAAPPAGVLTNVECAVDLRASPPRSRIILELVGEWTPPAPPEVRLGYPDGAVTLTIPKVRPNMPSFRLPVLDGLVETVTVADSGSGVSVAVETRFAARAEVAWVTGLPARLIVELPRSGPTRVLSGRKIGLDPGHGGRDAGAVGVGYREADIALSICRGLARWLVCHRATVVATRQADRVVPASLRLNLLREGRAGVYVGVHTGASSERRRRGTAVLCRCDSESRRLARCILDAILAKNPFLVDDGIHPSEDDLLRRLRLPAVVVMPEYITCHLGEGLLRDLDFREAVAQSIFTGLLHYYQS